MEYDYRHASGVRVVHLLTLRRWQPFLFLKLLLDEGAPSPPRHRLRKKKKAARLTHGLRVRI